jgi:CRP-like cAMP-binding protein
VTNPKLSAALSVVARLSRSTAALTAKARAQAARRDAAIRAARAEGATFRALAEAAGLTPRAVFKIVEKGERGRGRG